MKSKHPVYEDREEAILVALKRGGRLAATELFRTTEAFFVRREQFSGTISGMTRSRKVVVDVVGDTRFYSLPPEDRQAAPVAVSPVIQSETPPCLRIDELYTRNARDMVNRIRARQVKPYVRNNPDKPHREAV